MIAWTKYFFGVLMVFAACSGAGIAAPLQVEVFTAGPAGFHVTSTLVSGEKEALLVDAQFTLSEAHRLTAQLLESGKELKQIFITHAHPDHYFEVVLGAFPKAEVFAKPEVVEQMQEIGPEKLKYWKTMYGRNLIDKLPVVKPWTKNGLTVEGEDVQLITLEPGEIEHSTVVYIPSAEAVIAGDLVYNGVHVWLAETNAERRAGWLRNIEKIRALNPKVVVAGHKAPRRGNSPEALDETKTYIEVFVRELAVAKDAKDLEKRMLGIYPEAALPIILTLATEAMY